MFLLPHDAPFELISSSGYHTARIVATNLWYCSSKKKKTYDIVKTRMRQKYVGGLGLISVYILCFTEIKLWEVFNIYYPREIWINLLMHAKQRN